MARAKVLAMAVVLGSLGGCGGGAGGGDGGGPSAANGTLFPWRELDPLPQPRVGHCAAVVGNYLVVIGGSRPTGEDGDLEASEEVWAASLGAGGNLGRWEPAGSTPDPVAECNAVARGDRLYLIGGRYDAPSQGLRVYAADLGAGGSLTTFTQVGSLPEESPVLSAEAWVVDDLMLVASSEPALGNDAVAMLAADIRPNGSLGGFARQEWLSRSRGRAAHAFTGTFAYTLGGQIDDEISADVSGVLVSDTGAIGEPFDAEPLPSPRHLGEAVVVDEWLFYVAGRAGLDDGTTDRVYSAPVMGGGELGPWRNVAPLPEPRIGFQLVLAGDFLYAIGGGIAGDASGSVFAAQVRFE